MQGTELKKRNREALALNRYFENFAGVESVRQLAPKYSSEPAMGHATRQPATLEELISINNALLYQMLQEFRHTTAIWGSQQHVFSRTQQVTVATTETLLYANMFPYPITLVVFNMDPAQTVRVGRKGLTVNDSIPIVQEQNEKFTIQAGDSLYARVASGTVDVRFYTTQQRRM